MPPLPGLDLLHGRTLAASFDAFARVHLLRAGVRLGLFEALRRPHDAGALADRLGLAGDLVASWLTASQRLGLVHATGAEYQITDFTRWILDAPEAPALQAMLDQVALGWGPRLLELPQLMKGADRPRFGNPEEAQRIAAAARAVEVRALAALARIPGVRSARRILDVGCGHGSYLAGFLVHYRDAQGVGVDLDPAVAEEARRRLREAEVWRRGEIRVGDFMTMDLPSRFDLVLFNNNLHYFAPSEHAALLRRGASRLTPGGVIAIQTGVVESGPVARLLGTGAGMAIFDLYLRSHANLYGLPDLTALHESLRGAGFDETGEVVILPGGSSRYVWARSPRGEDDVAGQAGTTAAP
ncbi:MAG: class I SAM-dependent methyltransferase [Deltaproteobacteria bacterium]|nr:class I SAM-dependent methyltransferase [Deltaproteobacteria bacterium]